MNFGENTHCHQDFCEEIYSSKDALMFQAQFSLIHVLITKHVLKQKKNRLHENSEIHGQYTKTTHT